MNVRREYDRMAALPWWRIGAMAISNVALPAFWIVFALMHESGVVWVVVLSACLAVGLGLFVPTVVLKLRSQP
jgi:hypothetical protein